MNLIKSFNIKYLKENIKKSKGLIMLLLIVVPLLTTLSTVLFVNGENRINLATESSINIVNMLGMYVIPIGLSFALFGYVYRKNSVDLINSMPLNKQTIFVTNTVGGIILITLMQLVTVGLLFICGLACSNVVILGKMLIDIFIVMWTGYVFIFVATNLAMSVSGTFLTQLVLTALILFFVPFMTVTLKMDMFSTNYKIIDGSPDKIISNTSSPYYFSAPVHIPLAFLEYGYSYSNVSLAKTVVLEMIYLVIGLILFKRRKMEDTEESFRNGKIHLFVKALTVFPMIVLLNMVEPENIVTIFIIAIISIYYFAYDFVVKRKIKLIASVLALVLTIGISYGLAKGMEKFEEKIITPSRTVEINDIRAVSINLDGRNLGGNDYFIDNEDIMNLIIEIMKKNETMLVEYRKDTVIPEPMSYPDCTLGISYKTKTGKILNSNISLYKEELDKLIELLSKDEEYVKNIKNEYTKNGKIALDEELVSENFEEQLNLTLKQTIEKMTLSQIYENGVGYSDNYYFSLIKSSYNNHKLLNKRMRIGISEEIAKMIMEYQNKKSYNALNEITKSTTDFRIAGEIFDEDIIKNNLNYGTPYFERTKNNIIKFIKENENVECDPTKDFYQIYFYDFTSKSKNMFYTNKIEEINQIIRKEYENNQSENYYMNDSEITSNIVY